MSTFETIMLALILGFLMWIMVGYLRANPSMLSKANFAKTARTLALLSIMLIILIWVCVMLID